MRCACSNATNDSAVRVEWPTVQTSTSGVDGPGDEGEGDNAEQTAENHAEQPEVRPAKPQQPITGLTPIGDPPRFLMNQSVRSHGTSSRLAVSDTGDAIEVPRLGPPTRS